MSVSASFTRTREVANLRAGGHGLPRHALNTSLYRLLKNYCACSYGVINRLKMLIYSSKLRFFADLCLV